MKFTDLASRMFYGRTLHRFNDECECAQTYCTHDRVVASAADADLVSSLLPNEMHAPVIDLDLPCRLIESATPGHYHLYIDKAITWEKFERILAALADAGIVQTGYLEASRHRRFTSVRLPWKPKGVRAHVVEPS